MSVAGTEDLRTGSRSIHFVFAEEHARASLDDSCARRQASQDLAPGRREGGPGGGGASPRTSPEGRGVPGPERTPRGGIGPARRARRSKPEGPRRPRRSSRRRRSGRTPVPSPTRRARASRRRGRDRGGANVGRRRDRLHGASRGRESPTPACARAVGRNAAPERRGCRKNRLLEDAELGHESGHLEVGLRLRTRDRALHLARVGPEGGAEHPEHRPRVFLPARRRSSFRPRARRGPRRARESSGAPASSGPRGPRRARSWSRARWPRAHPARAVRGPPRA